MNRSRFACLPLLLVVGLAPAGAAPQSAEPAERAGSPAAGEPGKERRHGGHEGRSEFGVPLGRLLEMDDARLVRMRGLIERVEKIPAPERLALRRRLQAAESATPAEREALHRELREKFGAPEPEGKGMEAKSSAGKPGSGKGAASRPVRDLLEKHFSSMPPERAKAEKEKFLAMPRDAKMAYLKELREKHGLPAAPEKPAADESMTMRPASRKAAPVTPKGPDRDDPFGKAD